MKEFMGYFITQKAFREKKDVFCMEVDLLVESVKEMWQTGNICCSEMLCFYSSK